MNQVLSSTPVESLPPITYKGLPVIPTEMLAQVYEVEPHQIRQNFKNNRARFIEGKHFFLLSGNDLREFKNCVENFYSVQIGKRAQSFTLWLERGAARHAKMLNTDKAWDVFELLEETFFRVAQPEPPTTTLTPSQCRELHNVMDAKLSQFPASVQGKARSEAWTRFNRKFRIARYEQLPAHLFAEGMDYLIGMQIKAVAAPAAPRPLPSSTPAIDEYKRHVDNVLVALTLFRSNVVMDAQLEAGAKRLSRRDLWPIQQALFDAIGANAAAIESSKRLMDVAQQVLMQQM